MQLTNAGLKHTEEWLSAGYSLPTFNHEEIRKRTIEQPFWIHFGAGNIFRAFPANAVQNLLNKKLIDRGIIVVEGYDYEIIEKINRPHHDYSILVTLKSTGTIDKTVVGSIVESHTLASANKPEYTRLKEIFQNPSLQMATFTITEKGYQLVDGLGNYLPNVQHDMENGPAHPISYLGKVISLLYERYQSNHAPIAMVSMDNCSHNGTKLYESVNAFAVEWSKRGLADSGFLDYVNTPECVSFPWTMIDKITPRPDPSVELLLQKDNIEDLTPIITSKHTYIAPFVNAEESEYLVIEDTFPNGRPPLEQAGFLFTTRETVDLVEKMKVCTCLNPLHTALAVFGCLLGYKKIADEMKNPLLKQLVERIGYDEGLPVVVDPKILSPKAFLDQVLGVRIPNPFLPDTPQRIATDTSQKLSIRFGETIKAYEASSTLQVSDLKLIPLVLAGWLRYLMAIDDQGCPFTLSPDPMLETLCPYLDGIHLGSSLDTYVDIESKLRPILKDRCIFGVNLYDVGMAGTVCDIFIRMIVGTGAVEKTLADTLASLDKV